MVKTGIFSYGAAEIEFLCKADPILGAAIQRIGFLDRTTMPDVFAALIHAIVGQLVSAKSAQTIWTKMLNDLDEFTPKQLAQKGAEHIQSWGMTMKKARTIEQISNQVARGEIRLEELAKMPDSEAISLLCELPGIGPWTAKIVLLHSLKRPDIVSWEDIAIRRGMCKLYQLDSISKKQFEAYCQIYSPYGSVASIYLWHLSFE